MSETPNTITGIKRELLMRLGHDADIWTKKKQRKKQQDWQRKKYL